MNTELQNICGEFIEYRDEVKKAFKLELDTVIPVCANIFLSHKRKPDAERLKECKGYIKERAGVLNNFRGAVFAPSASLLACSSDPEGKAERAFDNYKLLKQYFPASEHLVLASMLLTDTVSASAVREKAERGRELYDLLKDKHRFLTSREDSVFAVLMAFSERSNAELIDGTEKCMKLLDGMAGKDYLQTAALIFALCDRPVEESCARFRELFEGVRAAGMKYGKDYRLAVLAALSAADAEIPRLVADIAEVDAFLKTQKGYKGLFGADKRTRLMHAAMLVNTYYAPAAGGDVAAISAMLAAVAVYMIVIMCIVMNSANAASIAASAT